MRAESNTSKKGAPANNLFCACTEHGTTDACAIATNWDRPTIDEINAIWFAK